MNVRLLHWKRAARAVLFILLLSVAGMTNAIAHDFEVDNLLYTITSTNPPTVSLDGHVDGTDFEDELFIPSSVSYENVTYAVTAISANAFEDYSLMYGDLVIPSSVTTIGDYAFYNCSSLDGTLTIGESVTNIGSYAFANLFGMTTQLSIPNSVTQMGDHAFAGGNFMGSISISSSLTSIPDYAFQGCAYISGDLTIPNSVTVIGNHAFHGCSALDGKLVLSNSLTHIGDCAFCNCTNLTNMGAFQTNGIIYIGDYAFYGCSSLTGQLSIYNTVESIGYASFYNCSGFTSISFNNTNPQLASIGDWAFGYCTGFIGNLALPKSLLTIGDYAFNNCTGFNGNLTFRSGILLQSIGAYAFSDCNFKNPSGLVIPNTVTTLGVGAFSGCNDFTGTLTLGSSLTAIPNSAFSNCTFTGQLSIPASVTSIGDYAFSSTHFSGVLNLPANLTSIGSNAFADCTGYTGTLTIPESVTSIGSEAFANCTGFTQLDFNAVDCSISSDYWDGWLSGCTALTNLNLGNNVQTISAYAFRGCSNLTGNLVIPNSVTTIGERAFYGCTGFNGSLMIGEGVTSIGEYAFANCSNITILYYNAINSNASNSWYGWIEYCGALHTLYLGENVQVIPENAFNGNNVNFTGNLAIPASVTSIGSYAFSDNSFTSLTSLAETPPTMGEYVFNGMDQSTVVIVPCGFEQAYSSLSWGGFSHFNGLCSGTVTVAASPAEGGTVTGGGSFEGGQSCTVTATANTGYVFANWTANGMLVSTLAEYTFPVAGDMTLVAHFVPEGNIVFADANVKAICVEHWDTNGDGELSYVEAASVTDLRYYFQGHYTLTSFDELQYFIGLTAIGTSAFSDCQGLISIVLPESIMSIGSSAFRNCSGLTGDLIIPNSVASIGYEAFRNCSGFTGSLTIGENVTNIEEYAFRYCSGFTTLYCLAATPPTLGYDVFYNMNQNIYVYVPCDAVDAYQDASWGGFSNFHGLCAGSVTVSASPVEGGTVTGGGSFEGGQYCTVSATANTGYAFANWTANGRVVSSVAEYSFPVAGDMTLVAHFVPEGNIVFADANVKAICVEHWDTNGDGELSYVEAASVTDLGEYFRYNSDLTSFDELQYFIGLSSIPYNAFHSCSNLISVVLPESITVIDEQAFQYCNSLSGTLVIPNSVTSIGFRAFEACYGFTGDLVIPNSVSVIEQEAFKNCTGFNGILTIGESVTSIGVGAFKDCSSLTGDLVIPNTVVTIGSEAFESCSSFNGTLTIGEGVTSIENGTFSGCSGFTSVVFSNSLTSIGTYAFNGCTGFTGELVIPNSVTTIEERAFRNCSGFTTLTLGSSVTSIGSQALRLSNLTTITVLADTPPTLADGVFDNVSQTIPVYVPCDAVETYQNASWGGFSNFNGICGGVIVVEVNPAVGGTTTGAGTYEAGQSCTVTATANAGFAFANWTVNGTIVSTNSEYTFPVYCDMTIVAHFVTDGNIVFADANVKSICVANWDANSDGELSYAEAASVTDLSNYFQYNSSITSFDELQYFIGLSTIGDNAFYNCYGLTSTVLPSSLTSIGNYALYGCYGLTSIVLPSSLTSIGNYAFYSCSGLTSIVLPSSLTTIGNYAFYYCSNIQSITSLALVPPTIMGYYTLNYCYNKPLYIPCGTLEAYQNATYWSNFTNIQIESNDHFVQDGLRYEIISTNPPQVALTGFAEGTYSAENLVIPASIYSECSGLDYAVTQIADSAFIENEDLLGTLTLPASLTRIGNSAFDGCMGLNGTLVIPENVTWIGRWAFYACEFTAIHYNATNCESIGYTEDNELGACFLWNNMLEEIVIGDNVTQIPAYAFAYTYATDCQLSFGNSVQTIGEGAFRNVDNTATGLTGDLVIPASVTNIGNRAFAYNYNLTGTLVIPENMNIIGPQAFARCGFASIHYNAINCQSIGLVSYNQYEYAFWNNTNLQEIVIGDNVIQIPSQAFTNHYSQNCRVDLGNSVQTINSYAFYNWTDTGTNPYPGLVGALVIPASVTTIYNGAFYGCSGLTEIWCKRTTRPTIYSYTFENVDKSIPVHVPCGSLSNYQSASYWSAFTNYSENPYVLVVRSNDEYLGNATVTQYGTCSDNGSIVHAEANLGGAFVNWTTLDGTFVTNNADYTFALTNDITLVANFVQLEGHHNFVGSGDWNDVDNWSPKELPTETSTVGIFGYAHLYDNVTVASATVYNDYFISIHPDAALSVTGTLTTSDDSRIYLQEGAQLYHANDGVNVELVRTITPYTTGEADGWHLIASPLEEEVEVNEVENLTDNEYDLYYYDEPTHYWMNQEYAGNGFNTLENAKGYLYGNNGVASYTSGISQLGETNSYNYYVPMATNAKYSISEQLFRATELAEAGVTTDIINSISWYSKYSCPSMEEVNIWMANVNEESLSSTSHNTSNMTLVYSGNSSGTSDYNVWMEYVFNQNKFSWDGTSSILVCIQKNANSSAGYTSWGSNTSSLGFNASSYNCGGNAPYDMTNHTYSTNVNNYRPAIKFKMESTGLPFEAQVGDGETPKSQFPIHTLWNYSISEQLYKADELNEAGVGRIINSLSWYATAVGQVPTQYGISIWMANVSDTYLTTTSHNTSNMTLVYYGSFTPQVGWNEFAFNWNDFEWDGTSNVLVCVQRNNGDWKSGLNWQTHTTNFNASGYKGNDNSAYYMSSNTYTTTVIAERANTLFKCVARNTTLAFAGEVKNGAASVSVPLSYTETAGKVKGFNLVGNPYAHNVTSYGSVNVANGCYVMNEAKDDLVVSEITEENPLKPLEGFFVKATSADASITFNPQRGASTAISSSIRVEVSKDNKLVDRLIVKDSEGQSLEKLNLNEQRTQVFAVQGQKEVAIVPCEGNEQPFSFKASKDGNYTINVNADDMEFTYLHLIDNLTGNDVNLLVEPSYTFEAKTTDYASRFKLVFATGSSEDPESDSFAFFNSSGNLTIFGIEGEVTLQVVDVLGHVLSTEQFSGSYEKKLNVAPGVYMLRLINGDDVKVQKIIVR